AREGPLHPRAARGGRGVHGLRVREVHGAARLLHRDLGAGRPLTGQTYSDLHGAKFQQEVDLKALFGGFTMLMGELLTAVKYGLPIVCVVIKNNSLAQIKWEQIVFLGNPEYGCDLSDFDFAKFAEACGAAGWNVERPEEIRPALEAALASGK